MCCLITKRQCLLGLACNESTADLSLDISSNVLGSQGAHVIESVIHGVKCLASLDISDNNLEVDLAGVVTACSKNKSLKHLNLGRNLQSTKAKHVSQVMEAVVQLLQDEDCVLQTLSLTDSKLKGELFSVINALGSSQSLLNIDISGNQIGDIGARLLAKALQINNKLRCITYDRNNITLQGFSDIAYGLESNMHVRYMPYPIHDTLPMMKVSSEKTEAVMKRIQDLIYRNSLPTKTSNGQQAFRLQQGFLLSSATSTVDKLISQTQEGVKLLKKNELNSPSTDASHSEVITHAENLIQDSEKAKQLLLSLHDMIEQKGEAGKVVESKLLQLSDGLHSFLEQHIQGNIDNVLELTEEKCPSLMAEENLKYEIKQGCIDKSTITQEFVRHCVMDMAGTDIINKLNEVHLAVASHISDKGDVGKKRSSTPDVLKTRSIRSSPSELSKELAAENESGRSLMVSDQSPMATPQMHQKRKGLHGRRIRPKSVVDCVEGVSADDIPDLLPSIPSTIGEEELPPVSPQQLKHLGKMRPKKPKSRAPTRPCLRQNSELIEEVAVADGLDSFFRNETPTPLVTPDSSDECSTSLMISMTSNADDTPTHSSRTFKVDQDNRSDKTSPSVGSFDSCSISSSKLSLDPVPRSKSTDCLEKRAENSFGEGKDEGQKSPVQRMGVTVGTNVLAEMKARQEKRSSGLFTPTKEESLSVTITSSPTTNTITTGVSVSQAKEKFTNSQNSTSASTVSTSNVTRRNNPPPVAPKPRPWSHVGADRRSGDYSMGSDGGSSPSANTPSDSSGDLLSADTSVVSGKISPSTFNLTHNQSAHYSVMEKFAGLSNSSVSTIEASSLPPSSSPSNHHHLLNNQNQTQQPISLVNTVNSVSGGSSNSISGAISINLRSNKHAVNNDSISVVASNDHSVSPVSLPTWSVGEKRSVKELAASLARHQSNQESDPKSQKKSDSLPRNVPATSETADFNRARVSIQEWTRHQSINEVWKFPLKKLSTESKPVFRKLGDQNEQNNGLRKVSTEESDVVNV